MLQGIYLIWFPLLALSFIACCILVRNLPVSWIQKLGWLLVVAYTGPIGLFCFLLTCYAHQAHRHEEATQALWKQAMNSEVHCVAGDATGIILSAIVLSFFSLANGLDIFFEYIFAYTFGLFIFQAGMMRSMYKSYGEAVLKTIFAETVSMNFVMIGMIPVMVILMTHIAGSRGPVSWGFWFRMDMASITGLILAYPINYWLVKNKLKHGCMTVGQADDAHAHYAHHQHKPHQGNDTHSVAKQHHHGITNDTHKGHTMPTLSLGKQFGIVITTFIVLFFFIYLTSLAVPLTL